MHRIVVDAMGGDHAPDEIVQGAAEASLALHVGRDHPRRRRRGARPPAAAHAPRRRARPRPSRADVRRDGREAGRGARRQAGGVDRGRRRSRRARRRRRAGLGRQHRRVACSRARGAGRCSTASGAPRSRPCIPTELRRGEKDDPFSLILDVGATIDATAEDLVGFAVMGSAYAKLVSQNRRPRVALLSNGTEAGKGPPEVVAAHAALVETTELNFIGNIEGLDIPRGVADVVVTSGFVGNVVLKMLEGVSETVVRLARYAHKERLAWRLGLDRAVVGDRSAQVDHRLAAVRRRAAARLHASVHQGARPLERARDHERDQGRAQGARRQPVRQHRAHDGRARRARAAPRRRRARGARDAPPAVAACRCGSASASACSSPTCRPLRARRDAAAPHVPLGPRQDVPAHRVRLDRGPREERDRDRRRQAGVPGRDRAAARAAPGRAPDLHRVGQPDADAPGARRQARARRHRRTTSSSSRTTSRTSCAAGSARCARRSRTSCRRCCARGSRAAADAETLFGDDAEADAIIYCLYADLVAGRVSLQRSRARADRVARVRRRRRSTASISRAACRRATRCGACSSTSIAARRRSGSAGSGRGSCRCSTTSRPRSCSTRTRCCRRAR